MRREYGFTKGRIIVRGKLVTRGKAQAGRLHPLLQARTSRSPSIEAKDNNHSVGDGMQQALEYAETLDIPFVFSSNGDGFVFHDRTGASRRGRAAARASTSSRRRRSCGRRYCAWKGLDAGAEAIVLQDYYDDGSGKDAALLPASTPSTAPSRPIAKGQNRILLVMATGTGKTYTAFQIIWRLWKAGREEAHPLPRRPQHPGRPDHGERLPALRPAMAMHRRSRGGPRSGRTRAVATRSTSRLYQAITGTEDEQKLFREFSPDFFDLIVVDECHRGSAADDSAWREILDYFSAATQIGLTATPKETEDVSNIDYFGEPGLHLLAASRASRTASSRRTRSSASTSTRTSRASGPRRARSTSMGKEIEDRIYNQNDFDRTLVLDERDEARGARRSPSSSESDDRFDKTIVFCEDIDHAERDAPGAGQRERRPRARHNRKYVMRITGDNPEGKARARQLHRPRDDATRSSSRPRKLLTTGVDAQTCKLIVLDQTHRLDDRVQADHRTRHPDPRGLRQALLHHHGLPKAHRALRRSGLRRRARCVAKTRQDTSSSPVPPRRGRLGRPG